MLPQLLLPLLLYPLALLATSDLSCTTFFSPDCDSQNKALSVPKGKSDFTGNITYNIHIPTQGGPFNSMKCSRDLKDSESMDISIIPRGFDLRTGLDADGNYPGKTVGPVTAKCALFQRKMVKRVSVCQVVAGTCYQLNG